MIGNPLQLQTDGADNACAVIGIDWGQCFDRLSQAQAVADSGVTGYALGQDRQAFGIGAQ